MNITRKDETSTSVMLVISLNEADMKPSKEVVLKRLGKEVKIDGFRKGHAPAKEVAKAVDQAQLSNEFLNQIVPEVAGKALDEQQIATALPPQVNVTKFVPFSELEIECLCEFVGKITLANYKKVKKQRPNVEVTDEDVESVTKRIQMDMAERTEVKRASKDGDQVWIDFEGKDTQGKPIDGAKGEDYPLALGSNTFIPGFEENLVGLKTGEQKEFTLTFPKDYSVKTLANKDVTFTVTVKKVQEVTIPKIDDDLAKKIGPYESADKLLEDIKKQVKADKIHKSELEVESEFMRELADKSEVELPAGMISQQIERMVEDHKANLQYRGQTYEQWLEGEGQTEDEFKESLKEEAINRLKGGVLLSEIAKKEGIELSEQEIDQAVASYKQQYASDERMQAELEKPAARRDIAARILTDRTLARLKEIILK